MKTRFGIKDWVFPFLGAVLIAGTLVATRAYCDLDQKAYNAEALSATLGRLYENQQMSLVLKNMQDGDLKEAARRLDLVLCNNILRLDQELASADARTLTFVQDSFRRMAVVRPKTAGGVAADGAQNHSSAQSAAEKVLARALSSGETAQVR